MTYTKAKRAFIRLCSLVLLPASVEIAADDTFLVYRTEEVARIQTCTGFILKLCSYENVSVPEYIDTREPSWMAIASERKSGGYIMCYQPLPQSFFSEKQLMFRCEPIQFNGKLIDPSQLE